MIRSYIHAGDVCTELAVVKEDTSDNLREDNAKDVDVSSIRRERIVINIGD
jgi:hypothetical protein